MEIKSIQTNYVTENKLMELISPEFRESVTPHYETTIQYTHPRNGERTDRVYSAHGKGATEYASEQDALANLRREIALEVDKANAKYWSNRGVYYFDA